MKSESKAFEFLKAEGRGPMVITGSAGYIGNRLAERLERAGVKVIRVVRDRDGDDSSMLYGDLSEPEVLDSVLTEEAVVFHLASRSNVPLSVRDSRGEIKDNLQTALEVLDSVRNAGCRMVLASSMCVADPAGPLPHSEKVLYGPRSPYGACKAAAEIFAQTFYQCYGTDTRIVRIGTAFGPGLHRFAIYDFYKKIKENPKEIQILGDGNQTRDYLYIDDLLEGLVLVAARGRPGECYNLGSGETITSAALARKVAALMGHPDIRIHTKGITFPGDVPKWSIDISKIRELGFETANTFEEDLAYTLKSFNN